MSGLVCETGWSPPEIDGTGCLCEGCGGDDCTSVVTSESCVCEKVCVAASALKDTNTWTKVCTYGALVEDHENDCVSDDPSSSHIGYIESLVWPREWYLEACLRLECGYIHHEAKSCKDEDRYLY